MVTPCEASCTRRRSQLRVTQTGGITEQIDHAFQFSNRQKRSVVIALDTVEGRDVALSLIDTADVVLMNLLPRRRERFGLTPEAIRRRNPTVVVGVLTGFGEDGPDADVPGYDLTAFFARSGLSASVGGFDGRPPRWRAAQGDHVAGLALYSGVMTALFSRAQTGEGSVVETSLLASAAWTNAFDLTRAAADGRPARAKDRFGAVSPTVESFLCADDRFIQLSLAEPISGWGTLCRALDRADLAQDERFANPADRFSNMRELIEILDTECQKHGSESLVAAILAAGGVAAVVMQSHEVVADPQVLQAGVLRTVSVADTTFDVVAPPFRIDKPAENVVAIGAPGSDTASVLAGILGLDERTIAALEQSGAIGFGEHR